MRIANGGSDELGSELSVGRQLGNGQLRGSAVQINPWPQKGTEGAKMEKALRLNFRIFATFCAFLWREKWPQNF
jgi:hypothetical protein